MNTNPNKETYSISAEQTAAIQKIYNDLMAHKAVLSEVISSNPTIDINNTLAYSQLKDLMREYDNVSSDIIGSTTGLSVKEISSWEINFENKILTITR